MKKFGLINVITLIACSLGHQQHNVDLEDLVMMCRSPLRRLSQRKDEEEEEEEGSSHSLNCIHLSRGGPS